MSSGSGNFLGIKITANLCFCCHAENKCYQCWLMLDLYWYTAKLRFFCCQETLSSRMSSQRRINTRNSKKSKAPLPSTSTSSLHAKYKAFEAFEYVILMWFLYESCLYIQIILNNLTLLVSFCTLWLCDVCVSPWVSTASQLVLPQKNWSEKHFTKLSLNIIDIATLLLNINTVTDYHWLSHLSNSKTLWTLLPESSANQTLLWCLLSKAVYRIWKR